MRPGGAMARRQLHFIWLLDASGSMNVGGKIQALNQAIRQTIPLLQSAALANSHVEVLVRAIVFSSGARWHIETPTPVGQLSWTDMTAGGGLTDIGAALRLAAGALRTPPMPERAVSPVLVLVTDGHHTDDFEGGLAALMGERWGREAVRVAVAVGRDASLAVLQRFIGNEDIVPVQAGNPEALVRQIHWVSRSAIALASQAITPQRGGGAFFISYSRDDLAAARRLFDALQGLGADVAWFDKSVLKPGDRWEQKTVDAINTCRFFLPLLSRHTETRDEGFFREEWTLATERDRRIQGRKFIIPVVIDRDYDGDTRRFRLVPARFFNAQFGHAPDGELSAELRGELARMITADARPS